METRNKPSRERFGRYALQLTVAVLILLTLVSYRHVHRNGFVFDDNFYLVRNDRVQTGLGPDAVRWAFTTFYGANWQPVTWLSSMLDYSLYGSNPVGHHATSLIFHIVNAVLLLVLLRRMTGSLWKSAFVAALFALHPLHVESVAWASERKDVLSAFFMLITVWAYVLYTERPSLRGQVLVAVAFALGLMAKPMLVSLPILLLLLDYWPLGRSSYAGGKLGPARLVREKAPLIVLSLASCVITYLAQRGGGAVIQLDRFPLGLRAANAVVAYAAYIGKTIYPAGLAAYYPYPRTGVPLPHLAVALLVMAAITVLAFRLAKTRPYMAVGWLWYVITLVPVIGLVQVGEQSMADRYMYIPLIGLSVMIAWGVPDLLKRRSAESLTRSAVVGLTGVSGLVLVALMLLTSAQVGHWQSDYTLFKRAASVTRGSALIFSNYGLALAERGEHDQAIEQYRKAIEADPGYVQAYLNLGLALTATGKPDEALLEYQKALDINPDYTDVVRASAIAHHDIGLVLAGQGDNDGATYHFERAVALDPDRPAAHGSLAIAYYTAGKYSEAWREVRIVESLGMALPPGFLNALASKMPPP